MKKGVSLKQQKIEAAEPFFFFGGSKFQTLPELLETLKNCGEEAFRHHVNEEKNDFAAWIRHSMKNYALANRIAKINSKEETIKEIEKYLGLKEEKKETNP